MCPLKMTVDLPIVATVDVYILEGNLVIWLGAEGGGNTIKNPLLA